MTIGLSVTNDVFARDILTVAQLNQAVGQLLERSIPSLWVRGEISNFTQAASGHWYFTLKDSRAAVRTVMFRSRAAQVGFVPRPGDQVEVRARVSLYEPRGDYQLQADGMRRAGVGNLYEAFLRLKAQLQDEGLFDPQRKRQPARLPRAIGVVTSLHAAALRDVLSALARRVGHETDFTIVDFVADLRAPTPTAAAELA
ncbi:exodeoxyribonuclease VII large subunit, partial [Bordetella pertussis]|uniref:exodeoxyribonuclease VII large subunit n=1 Tax=Bordetella pertussis TaxID=520 RepID=UPI0009B266B3